MGGVTAFPRLPAAIAEAGATGMIAGVMLAADDVAAALDAAPPGEGAVGANFLCPFLGDVAPVEAAAERARIVDFFWGEPDPLMVAIAHAGGALAGWQVGSADEARAAAHAGCDLVVAQGVEAGGHVRGRLGLLPLLDAVLEAVDVPVVAAGGIATARGVAAALAAGADAVRVGTRLLATTEAAAEGVHPAYVDALRRADAEEAVLGEWYSVMWPDAPHRVLRSAIEAAQSCGEVVGHAEHGGQRLDVARWSVIAPTVAVTGAAGAMALYAGQSVGAVRDVLPAGEVVRELIEGAEALLARAAQAASALNSA
jgi:NAD(P)H-dependent flavin oxidoreductase YrpB (nitropropane dioxygenase family)